MYCYTSYYLFMLLLLKSELPFLSSQYLSPPPWGCFGIKYPYTFSFWSWNLLILTDLSKLRSVDHYSFRKGSLSLLVSRLSIFSLLNPHFCTETCEFRIKPFSEFLVPYVSTLTAKLVDSLPRHFSSIGSSEQKTKDTHIQVKQTEITIHRWGFPRFFLIYRDYCIHFPSYTPATWRM